MFPYIQVIPELIEGLFRSVAENLAEMRDPLLGVIFHRGGEGPHVESDTFLVLHQWQTFHLIYRLVVILQFVIKRHHTRSLLVPLVSYTLL